MTKNTETNLMAKGYRSPTVNAIMLRAIAQSLEDMEHDGKHVGMMAKYSVHATFAYPGETATRGRHVLKVELETPGKRRLKK